MEFHWARSWRELEKRVVSVTSRATAATRATTTRTRPCHSRPHTQPSMVPCSRPMLPTLTAALLVVAMHATPATAVAVAQATVAAPKHCTNDTDCNMAGRCALPAGTCACDHGWTGPQCERINFGPAYRCGAGGLCLNHTSAASGNYSSTFTSSWGGEAVEGDDGAWHVYAAAFAKDGGLGSWLQESRVVHGVSPSGPHGPYTLTDVALGPRGAAGQLWDGLTQHNPAAQRDPATGTCTNAHAACWARASCPARVVLLRPLCASQDGVHQPRTGHSQPLQNELPHPCDLTRRCIHPPSNLLYVYTNTDHTPRSPSIHCPLHLIHPPLSPSAFTSCALLTRFARRPPHHQT